MNALKDASELGLSVGTVLDVGVAYRTFTLKCQEVFPQEKYILIERIKEYSCIIRRTEISIKESPLWQKLREARKNAPIPKSPSRFNPLSSIRL